MLVDIHEIKFLPRALLFEKDIQKIRKTYLSTMQNQISKFYSILDNLQNGMRRKRFVKIVLDSKVR